jgi:hypothetical protein
MKHLILLSILAATLACESAISDPIDVSGALDADGTTSDVQGDANPSDLDVTPDTILFCEDMVAACPEQDTLQTCLHSCEQEVDVDPDAAALACAAAAKDCAAVNKCWPLLFN